jgi:hypothetical protein
MEVLRLRAYGELCLYDKPEPIPVTGGAVVPVKVVSVCRSDLYRFSRGGMNIASSSRIKFEITTSNHGR